MHQILQDTRSGDTSLVEVPPPALASNCLRVRTAASLISAGTERYMIDMAKKSLVGKARARPDLVAQVIEKAKREGIVRTARTVFDRLERPMPLGYSAAGIVERVGPGVDRFQAGDRVAIAGAGYANHAEMNCVPSNLAARVPANVDFRTASYTTVASIAMQGVRSARPEVGEYVVVIGLGLIGLVTVQLLRAAGCRVVGVDPDPARAELALSSGASATANSPAEALRTVQRATGSRMADHVLITAATPNSGPVELAGELTRRKGTVVVVGVVGMNVPRDSYYRKELTLKMSMSYGPGRYDPQYEEGGVDYPYDYVRWTEQRNMESVLALMSSGQLDTGLLTSHTFPFDRALDAYELISKNLEAHIGVVLEYDINRQQSEVVSVESSAPTVDSPATIVAGFIGAGNYAATNLLPPLSRRSDVHLSGLATATGLNAQQKARKFGFSYCTTDAEQVIRDESTDVVFIATRHATHAALTGAALEAGKHVFVEKPFVVSRDQLEEVRGAYASANESRPTGLMVGLNRRFAPMVRTIVEVFRAKGPLQLVYRVNSGHISTGSWLHNPEEGGGMLVGEMCHFIDLMRFVAGSPIARVFSTSMRLENVDVADADNLAITLCFENGSVGSLIYNTVGSKAAPKERLEVFGGGDVALLDDFRILTTYVGGRRKRSRQSNQDKGQKSMIEATIRSFREYGQGAIPFGELCETMEAVFLIRESVFSGGDFGLSASRAA